MRISKYFFVALPLSPCVSFAFPPPLLPTPCFPPPLLPTAGQLTTHTCCQSPITALPPLTPAIHLQSSTVLQPRPNRPSLLNCCLIFSDPLPPSVPVSWPPRSVLLPRHPTSLCLRFLAPASPPPLLGSPVPVPPPRLPSPGFPASP
ncbi:proline-rich receptor-like protein kinase PERK2 [Perca flavescens]|uniref:proline-rich receptor-like protein kinase PERK2 n=1 Tax=Perca flavescens TaxID=8167 RepID=UPI00106E7CCF|nr:proline-rich receptor-like protein kinase PERK2 [Perca flavescens]